MSQRRRTERAVEEPMDLDGGRERPAERDRADGPHTNGHTKRATSANGANERAERGEGDNNNRLEKLLDDFRALVPAELWARALSAAAAYFTAKQEEEGPSARGAHDAQDLRASLERLEKKVDKIVEGKTGQKSWAQVARGAASANTTPEQRVQRVPRRLFRELIVDLGDAGQDIVNRSPRDTVAAVNNAAGGAGAIAAKTLPKSGNVAITFEEDRWAWFAEETNQTWVTKAFGETALLKRRTFAVLAKGVRPATIDTFNGNASGLATCVSRTNGVRAVRVRVREPRRSIEEAGRPRSQQLLIEVHTVEEANKLIDRGVVIEYAMHPCERFEGAARAHICFKCGKWGHKALYCKEETARCLVCACAAHTQDGTAREREAQCPAKRDPATNKPKCINCNGEHPAFDARCKVAKEQRLRARERFRDRPLAFQAPPPRQGRGETAAHPIEFRANNANGAQEERPRKRPAKAGRPTDLSRAGQSNGSRILDFITNGPPPTMGATIAQGTAATQANGDVDMDTQEGNATPQTQ